MKTEQTIRKYLKSIKDLYKMVKNIKDDSITEVDLEKNKTMIATLEWVLEVNNDNK